MPSPRRARRSGLCGLISPVRSRVVMRRLCAATQRRRCWLRSRCVPRAAPRGALPSRTRCCPPGRAAGFWGVARGVMAPLGLCRYSAQIWRSDAPTALPAPASARSCARASCAAPRRRCARSGRAPPRQPLPMMMTWRWKLRCCARCAAPLPRGRCAPPCWVLTWQRWLLRLLRCASRQRPLLTPSLRWWRRCGRTTATLLTWRRWGPRCCALRWAPPVSRLRWPTRALTWHRCRRRSSARPRRCRRCCRCSSRKTPTHQQPHHLLMTRHHQKTPLHAPLLAPRSARWRGCWPPAWRLRQPGRPRPARVSPSCCSC